MTTSADKITMGFKTEYYPPHCDQQCVRCKEWKNLRYFKRYDQCKTGRYLMQYRTTVTCCECLDRMKKFNDRGKNGPKGYCLLYVTRKVQKSSAPGVTVKRDLKNSDTARITNYLQIVFNAERRGESIVRNTKSKLTSRRKLIMC